MRCKEVGSNRSIQRFLSVLVDIDVVVDASKSTTEGVMTADPYLTKIDRLYRNLLHQKESHSQVNT